MSERLRGTDSGTRHRPYHAQMNARRAGVCWYRALNLAEGVSADERGNRLICLVYF
jgi:hypothetical protein